MIETNIFVSISKGVNQTLGWINYMSSSLWALLTGKVSLDQLSGPLGIAKISGDTAQSGGLYSLIMLMAIFELHRR